MNALGAARIETIARDRFAARAEPAAPTPEPGARVVVASRGPAADEAVPAATAPATLDFAALDAIAGGHAATRSSSASPPRSTSRPAASRSPARSPSPRWC